MSDGRIVSLLASATEIVAALGLTDRLVAISHECDYPPDISNLPSCTAPKIDVSGSSGEIDRCVKEVVELGLSVYRVDSDKLRDLSPDLIVTQSQCDVCAVSERDLEVAVAAWTDSRPEIVSLRPDSLVDVWRDISNVARAAGVDAAGAELIADLQARMQHVCDRAATLESRPRVACIEWIDPLMAAGNWMPELVEMAGGINLFGEAGKHSPWMTWDVLAAADPDVVLILPCGFDIARSRAEMAFLTQIGGWADLKAVREGQVYVTDGNQYFNRPGPRLAESLEILAEILHPEHFSFGYRGRGWETL